MEFLYHLFNATFFALKSQFYIACKLATIPARFIDVKSQKSYSHIAPGLHLRYEVRQKLHKKNRTFKRALTRTMSPQLDASVVEQHFEIVGPTFSNTVGEFRTLFSSL